MSTDDEGRPRNPRAPAPNFETVQSTANTILIIVVITFLLVLIALALIIWLLVRSFQDDNVSAVPLQTFAANQPGTAFRSVTGTEPLTQSAISSKSVDVNSLLAPDGTVDSQPGLDELAPLPDDPSANRYVVLLKTESREVQSVLQTNDPTEKLAYCKRFAALFQATVEHMYQHLCFGFSTILGSVHLAKAVATHENVFTIVPDLLYRKCGMHNRHRPVHPTRTRHSDKPRPNKGSLLPNPPLPSPPLPRQEPARFSVPFSAAASTNRNVEWPAARSFAGWPPRISSDNSKLPELRQPVHRPDRTKTVKHAEPNPTSQNASRNQAPLIRPPRSWALDRIQACSTGIHRCEPNSAADHPLDIDMYTLDTGVDAGIPNLDVRSHLSFVPWEPQWFDYDGHGTHTASVACGHVVGVAQRARLHSYKVADRRGRATMSTLLAAIDAIGGLYLSSTSRPKSPAIVLLTTVSKVTRNTVLNVAEQHLRKLKDAGVHVVISAGNDGQDVALSSPGRVPRMLTVSAYDQTNSMPLWSNSSPSGMLAPGVGIIGFLPNNKTGMLSGTSPAAALAAGLLALYLVRYPKSSPDEAREALVAMAVNAGSINNPHIENVPYGHSVLSVFYYANSY